MKSSYSWRNVIVLSSAIFVLGFAEELWSSYIPDYLQALGAATIVLGLYGSIRDFLDAVYQYPGGRLTDILGRRKSLTLFTLIALFGYLIHLFSSSWEYVILSTFFVMAWSSFSLPATFAVIGDNIPKERRSLAFAFQSILKRIPIVLAPPIGGLMILTFGVFEGVKIGLLVTVFLAALTIVLQWFGYKEIGQETKTELKGAIKLFRSFKMSLKVLLVSDILVRLCEGLPSVFIIIYALNIVRIDVLQFGLLISIQMATSLVVYLPIAVLSDRFGRKPFATLTFVFFALYPLFIVLSHDFSGLIIAFIVGGLREIGEPSRKAMIVDLMPETKRGSSAGLYYFLRGLFVTPASLIGGLLWLVTPQTPFVIALMMGIGGTIVFALFIKEK